MPFDFEAFYKHLTEQVVKPRCGSCHFYSNSMCYRFPPTSNENVVINVESWCGEFILKRNTATQESRERKPGAGV